MRGAAVPCLALALGACARAVDEGPRDAREAMTQWVRCAFDGVGSTPPAPALEGALRQALRHDRGAWAVRAGRCESALAVRGETPACLRVLRDRWAEMLPRAQQPTDDPITLDVSVRRIGDAWTSARLRCP